jgi:hypothetical protein
MDENIEDLSKEMGEKGNSHIRVASSEELFEKTEKSIVKDTLEINCVDPQFEEDLKKKGFEIESIIEGYEVTIKRISDGEEFTEFSECIEEAIDNAISGLKFVKTLESRNINIMASVVWFDSNMMYVRLLDDREIGIPIGWFPKLRDATNEQRSNWRLIGKGIEIYWNDIDEDISVESLLL